MDNIEKQTLINEYLGSYPEDKRTALLMLLGKVYNQGFVDGRHSCLEEHNGPGDLT